MKTIGKVALAGAVLFIGSRMLKKGSTTTTGSTTNTAANNASSLNGKIVVNDDNGNWLAVIGNKSYFTANVQAIEDFKKQYGDSEIVHITTADLANYPIAGSIWENLELVPFGSTPKSQTPSTELVKRLGAPNGELCVRQNANGSSTYYTSQGGNNPCPYGGRIAVKKLSLQPAPGTYGLGNSVFLGV